MDDPAPGALYVVQEEGGFGVYVFLFQDDVCFFDLEGFDVLYDDLSCFLGGHEMGCYGCVVCAELVALWLVFCALGPGMSLERGRGCRGWCLLERVELVLEGSEFLGDALPLLDDGRGLVAEPVHEGRALLRKLDKVDERGEDEAGAFRVWEVEVL